MGIRHHERFQDDNNVPHERNPNIQRLIDWINDPNRPKGSPITAGSFEPPKTQTLMEPIPDYLRFSRPENQPRVFVFESNRSLEEIFKDTPVPATNGTQTDIETDYFTSDITVSAPKEIIINDPEDTLKPPAESLRSRLQKRALGATALVGSAYNQISQFRFPELNLGEKLPKTNRLPFYRKAGYLALIRAISGSVAGEPLSQKFHYLSAAKEKLEMPNKKQVAKMALGAVALTAVGIGVAYAKQRGFYLNDSIQSIHEQTKTVSESISQTSLPHHVEGSVLLSTDHHRLASSANHTVPAVHVSHIVKYHTETLKYYGDTMWYHVKANIHARFPNLSDNQLNALTGKYTQLAEKYNHIKGQGKHMFVGQSFKLPNILSRK